MKNKKLNAQKVMRISIEGILRQHKPSGKWMHVDGVYDFYCRYRGDDNCKCAIGHLIDDEDYKSDMEALAACVPSVSRVIPEVDMSSFGFLPYPSKNTVYCFYWGLQRCHDRAAKETKLGTEHDFLESFKDNIRRFCGFWNLKFPKDLFDKYFPAV